MTLEPATPATPWTRRWLQAGALSVCLIAGCSEPASPPPQTTKAAQALPAPEDGRWPFDFWVLALSWSPTHCGEDGMAKRDAQQCAGPRPYGFVVHGLWPQFEQGFPRLCPSRLSGPDRQTVDTMMEIMPSRRLVQIQWERHGTCSGLDSAGFFQTVRAARDKVQIPARFNQPGDWQQLSAADVEAAFIAANPGLDGSELAVESRGPRLQEVRICFDLQMQFRACREVDRGGDPPDKRLRVPPVRGG